MQESPAPVSTGRTTSTVRRGALFIVASPRPQVGKTFIARLLIDFLRLERRIPLGFDLNPGGEALRDYLPASTVVADIGSIMGEVSLFDRLIVDDGFSKVVDVGHAAFDRFFAIAQEIGFFEEARHSLDAMILFPADPHPLAVTAYAELRRRIPHAILTPVLNEGILKGRRVREQFPFAREAAVPLQIAALAPLLRTQMENASCSFAELHQRLPGAIPVALALELQAWTRRTFVEFRELDLRLLLEQLRPSLPTAAHRRDPRIDPASA
jgi:hypothetical protein